MSGKEMQKGVKAPVAAVVLGAIAIVVLLSSIVIYDGDYEWNIEMLFNFVRLWKMGFYINAFFALISEILYFLFLASLVAAPLLTRKYFWACTIPFGLRIASALFSMLEELRSSEYIATRAEIIILLLIAGIPLLLFSLGAIRDKTVAIACAAAAVGLLFIFSIFSMGPYIVDRTVDLSGLLGFILGSAELFVFLSAVPKKAEEKAGGTEYAPYVSAQKYNPYSRRNPSAPVSEPVKEDIETRLRKLKKLREEDLITEEEYSARREEILKEI